MTSPRKPGPRSRLKNLLSVRKAVPPEEQRARALIAAIDTGGILLWRGAAADVRAQRCAAWRSPRSRRRRVQWRGRKQLPHLLCVTHLMLHGIEVPSQVLHTNTLARPLRDYTPAERVDVVLTNPPFDGIEEPGIEAGFPADARTKETADLFLVLIKHILKPGGRAAVVLPDGTLFGEGVKTRIKQQLLEECDLHTIVRLPGATLDDLDPQAVDAARQRFTDFLVRSEHDAARHPALAAEAAEWSVETLLNKAHVTKQDCITRSALLLLGRDEASHFLAPADAKISWILRDADPGAAVRHLGAARSAAQRGGTPGLPTGRQDQCGGAPRPAGDQQPGPVHSGKRGMDAGAPVTARALPQPVADRRDDPPAHDRSGREWHPAHVCHAAATAVSAA
jgi:hypothetical protein